MTTYSPAQVRAVLRDIGIVVKTETWNDYLCLCPFHGNRDTPAFSVSQQKGSYICFSPQCGRAGTLVDLVQKTTGRNEFEALRFVTKRRSTREEEFISEFDRIFAQEVEFEEYPQEVLDRLYNNMWQLPEGRDYMHERKFLDSTLEYFRIGYSAKKNMVTVPVHSPKGVPIGMVGRSLVGKDFHNNHGLKKSRTIFNIHRARREGPTAIVNEASFSAMRLHQAGFPTGVALLGGKISQAQIDLLDRNFSTIIIATDFDDKTKHVSPHCRKCYPEECSGHNPGRDLGMDIATKLPYKEILWAALEPGVSVFGEGKDLDDLDDDQIAQAINNSMTDFEYAEWQPY